MLSISPTEPNNYEHAASRPELPSHRRIIAARYAIYGRSGTSSQLAMFLRKQLSSESPTQPLRGPTRPASDLFGMY